MAKTKFSAKLGEEVSEFEIDKDSHHLTIEKNGEKIELEVVEIGPRHYSVIHNGEQFDLRFYNKDSEYHAFYQGERVSFELNDWRSLRKKAVAAAGVNLEGPQQIKSMMPGKIAAIKVKVGDEVAAGQGVIVLEAMKMENELASPKAGKVASISVTAGQSVESGAVLAVIE